MRPLSDIRQGKPKYIAKAYLIALLSSALVALTIFTLFDPNVPEESAETNLAMDFIGLVLLAPAVETLLMIPIFAAISRITGNLKIAVVLSALVWALLHSLMWPVWGLVVFWSFLVYSYAFQKWRNESIKSAYVVVLSIHSLVNLTAFVGGVLS